MDTLPATAAPTGPVCVAYSGGLDSTVLLHWLAAQPAVRERGLRAVHVHHGLQVQADHWAAHCRATCEALGLPLDVRRVRVAAEAGLGPEAAARQARRASFATVLQSGEWLALAQHRDDQAETFLLRALRASGPDGLAAMRPLAPFAAGLLWRPLLDTPRAALLAWAQAHGLRWIEDPSNADTALDRNFLRHRLLPLLRERWPQADAAFARSAALCADTTGLLDDTDRAALEACRVDVATLRASSLLALPAPRRARVLRCWIDSLKLPPLPAAGLDAIERELLDARADAQARFHWHDADVWRWRDLLHAQRHRAPLPAGWHCDWDGSAPLALPGGGRLLLLPQGGGDLAHRPMRVHARRGGERIRLPGRAHSHALKHVLQQRDVPPWQRERLPLLSDPDGTLLAAGDLALSAGFDAWLRGHALHLHWHDAPVH